MKILNHTRLLLLICVAFISQATWAMDNNCIQAYLDDGLPLILAQQDCKEVSTGEGACMLAWVLDGSDATSAKISCKGTSTEVGNCMLSEVTNGEPAITATGRCKR